jgi:hypothetical protein
MRRSRIITHTDPSFPVLSMVSRRTGDYRDKVDTAEFRKFQAPVSLWRGI